MLKENSNSSEFPAEIRGNGKPDIRAGGKRLADDTAPHRAGEVGEGGTDARGRGRPRKTGPTRAGPWSIRMEDSVPTRKRGRPRRIPSIDAGSLRSITGMCRCGTLTQARQGPRSVREYTEKFLESAKRCKPKTAEDWCRWYKAGLREEIQGRLIGVLEPLEFALVNRMAGQAMEAERTLTRRVVAISSSEEDVEVEEDPSEDSDWEEELASPTGSGRAAGPKPDGEQKSPKRSPAENPRRSEALAVDSLSLRAVSLLLLSLRRVSSLSPSLLAASPSLSRPRLSLLAVSSREWWWWPRVVIDHRSRFLLPPTLRSRSRSRSRLKGAGKIESRRVLAGRGRNTLQRRSEPEELGGGPTRAGDFTGSSKKRGGMVRLSCVAVRLHRLSVVTRRFSFRIEPTISGNVNGKEGNATETHGTRNGTHRDVGKIDMCVLNPVPWNPGRKWEGADVSKNLHANAIPMPLYSPNFI
ncbi:hypothetical protein IGI04_003435 [Brassica rapa subsp. trilocularis]|uniref:Retrotransposon gag domain-containing protein n=1 Tax=Brassica rapa subsp. trilocularis TaxID=1813537 RepID=A0ABQ7NYG0_BRACM|nr:hypothetical protein IGI04_003435 [Brassica rapa subsp. trilocularis]